MRKFLILFLSVICFGFFAISFSQFSAKAQTSSPQRVDTGVFLPSSALQLYDLKSPVYVSYSSSGYMVITEHVGNADGSSAFDKISVFNPETEKFTALPEHETIFNVTHAQEYGDYLFYLSNSKLYYTPVSNLQSQPIESPVTSSNFFHIKGEFLLTNTNNSIVIYKISFDNGVEFTKQSTHNFTTKNAFISEDFNIYYLYGGKLYCFDTNSSTSYAVANVLFDVNYMTECGNYVYLTSSSGLYKVEKGKDGQAELVTSVTPNSTTLGYLKNPQGITVIGNDLIIADSDLKCVQAINSTTQEFTDFAITTESTADFRLTNNSSYVSLSESYLYALDDGAVDDDGKVYKRIVRISLDKNANNRYKSFNLKPLYENNGELIIKKIACSDTHVLIYADKTLALYDTTQSQLNKVFEVESESVTDLFYIDGEFFYTDYALLNFGYNAVNLNKITMPSEENGVNDIVSAKVNKTVEIKGVAVEFCVDVFGNYYVISNSGEEGSDLNLIKYSNKSAKVLSSINHTVKSMQVDFAGNVYVLSNDNIVYKYAYSADNESVEIEEYKLDSENTIKDVALNYKNSTLYGLSNACILKTVNNDMDIKSLTAVSADNVNATTVSQDNLFVTISSDAKIFKISLGDYDENNNFKLITPVSNPNSQKVYLVISEIDNYYLVAYSEKFVGLIRKTSVAYEPDFSFNSAIISENYYKDFEIEISDLNAKETLISNQTTVFAKPVFDVNYACNTLQSNDIVYALKSVTFNGVSMTLVSKDGSLEPYGYVISGYLTDEIITPQSSSDSVIKVVDGNGNKHFNNVLMIFIIALTVTLVSLFIEKKLLFDKESGANNE